MVKKNDGGLDLEQVETELKKLTRRVDELQKTVDLLFKDREILEDIQASIQSLKQVQISSREHHDNVSQGIKRDIKETAIIVEDKVDEALRSKIKKIKKTGFIKRIFKRKGEEK